MLRWTMTRGLRTAAFSAVLALTAPACQSAPSPPVANVPVPVEALREDFALMRQAVTEGAAALYRHHSRAEVDAAFDAAQARLTAPMTPVAFWRIVAPLIAAIDDGHLSARLDPSLSIQVQHHRRFPLRFQIIDGRRLYVLRNYSSATIATGSEILSIDGRDARTLIDQCVPFFAADGGLETRKLRKVEKEFSATCVPALGLGPVFQVAIRPAGAAPGAPPVVHALPGLTYTEWSEAVRRVGAVSRQGEAAFELETWPDRHIGLLTLGSFTRGDTFDPATRFAEAFGRLSAEGVTDLILDMRGSAGARDADGALLYAWMAPAPFRYVRARTLNKPAFEFLRRTADADLNRVLAGIPQRPTADGRIVLNDEIDQVQQPRPGAFSGRVYLIVDGNTFSTGSEFASIFQSQRRGPVIGQETGTAYEGGSGGPASLALPNSGVIVDVPLVAYTLAVEPRPGGRGVVPDIAIPSTVEAMTSDEDPVLARAVALIEATRANGGRSGGAAGYPN